MADYWANWLRVGKALKSPPKIFRTNWFRTDANGRFIWPGFGENLRVIKWVLERAEGRGEAQETPIGFVPTKAGLDRGGFELSDDGWQALLRVDLPEWVEAVHSQEEFFADFGARLPAEIREEHDGLARRIHDAMPKDVRNNEPHW
jgi:phosphoenolpyruvate carboxykinase (GTP)